MLGGWRGINHPRGFITLFRLCQSVFYSVHKQSFPWRWREGWDRVTWGLLYWKVFTKTLCFSSIWQKWHIFTVGKNVKKWIRKGESLKIICNIRAAITAVNVWYIAFSFFQSHFATSNKNFVKGVRPLEKGTRCSSIYQTPVLSGETVSFTSPEARINWKSSGNRGLMTFHSGKLWSISVDILCS